MQAGITRWSPDGKVIAFAGESTPAQPRRIYLVDAVGGSVRPACPKVPRSGGVDLAALVAGPVSPRGARPWRTVALSFLRWGLGETPAFWFRPLNRSRPAMMCVLARPSRDCYPASRTRVLT